MVWDVFYTELEDIFPLPFGRQDWYLNRSRSLAKTENTPNVPPSPIVLAGEGDSIDR